MKKSFKTIFLLLIIGFLLVGTGCESLDEFSNKVFNNESKDEVIDESNEFVTVTFDYGYSSFSKVSLEIKKDQPIFEPVEPSVSGYTFKGWYSNGNDSPFDFQTKINEDIIITGVWEETETSSIEDTITVTYDYNVPEIDSVSIQVFKGEKTFEPLVQTRESYIFKGWYSNLSETESFDFSTTLEQDLILTARWEESIPAEPETKDVTVTLKE